MEILILNLSLITDIYVVHGVTEILFFVFQPDFESILPKLNVCKEGHLLERQLKSHNDDNTCYCPVSVCT